MMQLTYVTQLSAIVGQKLPYLKALLATSPDRVILRAKHLSEADYQSLALELLPTSQAHGVRLIINHQVNVARALNLPIQVSFPTSQEADLSGLTFGVSVHSYEEGELARAKGASWLVYGHLFATSCKAGLAPRSMAVFEALTKLPLPVYGIGGIKMTNVHKLPKEMAGVYIMRDSMVQPDPHAFTKAWRDTLVTLT